MKKILLALLVVILFSRCIPEPPPEHLHYQNIVILSDLSSRIKNTRFPQKDFEEIHKIINFFKTDCVKPGKKIGDKSSIVFSAFSEKNAASINLDQIKDQDAKQSFIMSTNNYKNSGLVVKLKEFEDTVKSRYKNVTNPGLDLISLLIDKINEDEIVKQSKVINNGDNTTFIDYQNHVYIFTDGYLEYASIAKAKNSQFYFGSGEVEKVRDYCIVNQVDIKTALNTQKSLGLPAYKNSKNKDVILHILETHERDKDTKLSSYSHQVGLRDNEILEAVWCKWAADSGFKKLMWEKY